MNAIELLKEDHDTVEELFAKFKQDEDGRHGPLFKKIKGELDTHTHIEETVFYPKLLKNGDKELKRIVREGLEEHRQVKMFLKELSGMTAANKQYNAKLKVIVEDVEHHVKEEENDMFPMVEDQLSERMLENLGAAMQREKAAYQKKHGIKPAKRTVRKGTIETVLDTVKRAVGDIIPQLSEQSKPRGKAVGKTTRGVEARTVRSKAKSVKAKPESSRRKGKASAAKA